MPLKLTRRRFFAFAAGALAAACGRGNQAPNPTRTIVPPVATEVPPSPTPAPESLRGFADKIGLQIGISPAGFNNAPPEAVTLARQDFNLWSMSTGALFWNYIHPTPGANIFTATDSAISQASFSGLPIAITTPLVVWSFLPSWLAKQGGFSAATDYSPTELRQMLSEHVQSLVARYKDKVVRWVVVNETVYRGSDLQTFWYRNLGRDYVGLAFKLAREAGPNIQLIWNEAQNESIGANSSYHLSLLRPMLSSGVPIDGVGMQMHVDASNPPDKASVVANIRRFKDLGLSVHVTECDVNLRNVPGSQDDRFAKQAAIFADLLEAAIEGGASSFALFNPGDATSWLQRSSSQGQNENWAPNSQPTPWDDRFQAKPAYFAMLDVLRKAAS